MWLINTLVAVHASVTLAMTGLIWFVQLVHYPLLTKVGDASFSTYERLHQAWITPLVFPLMTTELLLAGWIAVFSVSQSHFGFWERWGALGLVGVAWASTAVIQVPLHSRLGDGFDAATVAQLVRTNWIRTFAWTARAVLVTLALVRGLSR